MIENKANWFALTMRIWNRFSAFIRASRAKCFIRKTQRVLKLNLQGGPRKDCLSLSDLDTKIYVEWRARDLHPWDYSFPPEQQSAFFVKQVLMDAELVISKLFDSIRSADRIDVRVLDQKSQHVIMNGVVLRATLSSPKPKSVRMWLGQLGLHFRLSGNRFEPLNLSDDQTKM